jgi:hypothetical protein
MSEPTWINQEKIYQEQVRKMREETSRIHATPEYIAFANEIARQDAIEFENVRKTEEVRSRVRSLSNKAFEHIKLYIKYDPITRCDITDYMAENNKWLVEYINKHCANMLLNKECAATNSERSKNVTLRSHQKNYFHL